MNEATMRVRSSLVRAVVAAVVALAACGESFTVLTPDAGIVVRSDNGTSLGAGGGLANAPGGNSGLGGGAAAVSDAGVPGGGGALEPCITTADCEPGDACSGPAACVFGFCLATLEAHCNDGDPCTVDTCAPGTGACTHGIAADGTVCLDDDRCDGQTCLGGACRAGTPPTCVDDGNPCTVEACAPATGACVTTPVQSGVSCEDGDACNGIETCANGVCRAGVAPACNDGNPCTWDACSPLGGCTHAPLADGSSCADGNFCNGDESCAGGLCRPGLAPTCNDGNACTIDSCHPLTGTCAFQLLPNGSPCPDDNLCDGQTCLNGACTAGPAAACANDGDGNPCTGSSCNPRTGACVGTVLPEGTPCPDADVCDGTETCRAGLCSVPGAPRSCIDDGNPCTREICDPTWGCTHVNVMDGTACADSSLCNGAEVCLSGVCRSGAAPSCADGNRCTSDICNPIAGCLNLPVADGVACADSDLCNGTERCVAGRCSLAGVARVCPDDGNACTRETCDSAWGCLRVNLAEGAACLDSDLCDGAESCTNGVCTAGIAVACAALQTCDPGTGTCR